MEALTISEPTRAVVFRFVSWILEILTKLGEEYLTYFVVFVILILGDYPISAPKKLK